MTDTATTPVPAPSAAGAPLVVMRNINVAFGGVHAVRNVTIDLFPGEVVGLVGGNGAGKSTLTKVLSGAQRPDSGEILINGEPKTITNPRDAKAAGIETIYQTLALADNLDAPANLFLGRELTSRLGNLDDDRMEDATRKVMGRLNPNFQRFNMPVKSLSGGRGDRPSGLLQREDPDHGRADRRARSGRDGPGPEPRPPAEGRGDRNPPDQPRHPRRL
jgi:D-xylose transport system ATP-binding protein